MSCIGHPWVDDRTSIEFLAVSIDGRDIEEIIKENMTAPSISRQAS